jgi:hypothetical protein
MIFRKLDTLWSVPGTLAAPPEFLLTHFTILSEGQQKAPPIKAGLSVFGSISDWSPVNL